MGGEREVRGILGGRGKPDGVRGSVLCARTAFTLADTAAPLPELDATRTVERGTSL